MKILVYGAGVLGCNLARNLFEPIAYAAIYQRCQKSWREDIPATQRLHEQY